MKKRAILIAVVLSVSLDRGRGGCSEAVNGWDQAGIRLGIQASSKREYFHRYDMFAVYRLPWEWRTATGWGAVPNLEAALGALHTEQETGFIGSAGAGLTIGKTGLNLTPELGVGLHPMNRRHFGSQDFGSILLWGAYAGLSYHFDCGPGIGYRIQHLSNNHILHSKDTPNPGVDMHMISVSWHF